MSELVKIKGLLLSEMKSSNPVLKKAIVNVINAIDSDLDISGYRPSSDVDDAFAELDLALIEIDESVDNTKIEESETLIIKKEILPEGYRDLNEEE